MNIHDAVHKWCMPLSNMGIHFNFSPSCENSTVIATSDGSRWLKRYLSGGIKEYSFEFIMFKPSTYDNGKENIDQIHAVQQAMAWFEEQNNLANFPDFGENNSVMSVECLSNVPRVAGNQNGEAKYMFPVRIKYRVLN